MSAIDIQQLSVQYQNTSALQNITLTIPEGVRGAIIGPNGAGKSTLLKSILNLIPHQATSVQIFDKSLAKSRLQIAYVPQQLEVNWQFPTTVLDVVLMGTTHQYFGIHRTTQEQLNTAHKALEAMQLTDLADRQINQLSGGQKQRVFVARAIAQNARLYLLDEPLAGVDMTSEEIMMNQLKIFQSQGKTSLTVHHDLSTVAEYFDYVILINHQLIAHGPVDTTLTEHNIQLAYNQTIGDRHA